MSPGRIFTGRWESEDKKLRPGRPNRDHLMVMDDEMAMRMKMKMRVLMRMLMMPMMIPEPTLNREINEREREEKINIKEREIREKMRK